MNHEQLLIVLLAEHGKSGLHDVEEFQNDCADSREKPGPELTFEHIGQLRRRTHDVALRLRIHFAFRRRKQNVAALGFQELDVPRQRARIAVEVVGRRELQPVDEDGAYDGPPESLGDADERKVPLMQASHGRNQGRRRPGGEHRAQLCDGVCDTHGTARSVSVQSVIGKPAALDLGHIEPNSRIHGQTGRGEIAHEARLFAAGYPEHVR